MNFSDLKQGDHICLIYESTAEQLAAAVPFITDGSCAESRCIYIADDRTIEEVVQALAATGVDVAKNVSGFIAVADQSGHILRGR